MIEKYDNFLEEFGLDNLGVERRLEAVLLLFEQADAKNLERVIEEKKEKI